MSKGKHSFRRKCGNVTKHANIMLKVFITAVFALLRVLMILLGLIFGAPLRPPFNLEVKRFVCFRKRKN